jgi:hypothetical protein
MMNEDFETLVKDGDGFSIKNSQSDEKFSAISSAGDFNGDGFVDVVVGSDQNRAYIVFGSEDPNQTIDVSQLDGKNGLTVTGIEGTDGSISVHSLGPLGGADDDLQDVIISAPSANGNTGEAYVLFGTDDGQATIDVRQLDGSNGFVIRGDQKQGRLGEDVGGIALFTAGDGAFDIAVTAPRENQGAGATYVIFGNESGEQLISDGVLNVADLDGSNGFRISGISPGDQSGFSVSGAGDINRDQVDDFIIGAPYADPNGVTDAGQSYIVFGGSDFSSNLDLSSLDGTNGLIINGAEKKGYVGYDVSGLFFFNEKFGAPDEVFGAKGSDFDFAMTAPGIESTYVLYGSKVTNNFDLSTLDGSNGLIIAGTGSGLSVSGAFDVNDDEIGDVIIGGAGGSAGGTAALIYGRKSHIRQSLDLDNLDSGDGFILNSANAGVSVGDAGFVQGSEKPPAFLVAVPESETAYVVYGKRQAPFTKLEGTKGEDVLNGGSDRDKTFGGLGDDQITGGDGGDVLRGDRNSRSAQNDKLVGDDLIHGDAGSDRIGGNSGNDRLFCDAGDDQIWGDDGDDIIRGGKGNDILTGDNLSGGQGIDTFVLARGEGIDRILDFESGVDTISPENGLTFGQLSFRDHEIWANEEKLAISQGVDTMTLPRADFTVI